MGLLQGLWLERIVVESVEVALEGERILCPDPFESPDEFLGTTIALVMFEP